MKNKKIIIIFSVLFIILLVAGYFFISYLRKDKQEGEQEIVEEYTPEEEISEEQSRQTIVSLYFQNKETKELEPEARLVDIKEMLDTPYDRIVNLLIEGPKNEDKENIFPKNTKLLNTSLEGDCLTLNFSYSSVALSKAFLCDILPESFKTFLSLKTSNLSVASIHLFIVITL